MAGDVIRQVLKLKDEASGTLTDVSGGAKEADDALDGADASAASFGVALAALAGVAVAAATAMFTVANAASEWVDETILMSRQTGLATETLIAMDFAAQAGGGSLKQFQAGMRTFVAVLGDTSEGSKEAIDKFDRLGVSTLDGAGRLRSMDDVLRDVLDSIAGLPTATERAAAAVDVFGSRGSLLVAVLGEGSAALEDWGKKATAAGLVIDRDAREASVAMDTALAELNLSLKAVTLELGEAFTPAVAEAIENLAGMVNLAKDLVEPLSTVGSIFRTLAIGPVVFDALSAAMEGTNQWADDVAGSMEGVKSEVDKVADAVGKLINEGAQLGRTFAEAEDLGAFFTKVLEQDEEAAADAAKSRLAAAKTQAAALRDTLSQAADMMAFISGELPSGKVGIGIDLKVISAEQTAALRAEVDATAAALAKWKTGLEAAAVAEQQRRESNLALLGGGTAAASAAITGDVQGSMAAFGALMGPAVAGPLGAVATGLQGLAMAGELGLAGVQERISEFKNNLIAGIKLLPDLIGRTLPTALADGAPAFIEALVGALPELVVALVKAQAVLVVEIIKLPFTFAEAIGATIRDWWDGAWDTIKQFFADLFSFRFKEAFGGEGGGKKAAGTAARVGAAVATFGLSELVIAGGKGLGVFDDGVDFIDRPMLSLLHPGEQVVQRGGRQTQAAGRGGGAGSLLSVNLTGTVIDRQALAEFVRRIEEQFGFMGTATSPLFNQG